VRLTQQSSDTRHGGRTENSWHHMLFSQWTLFMSIIYTWITWHAFVCAELIKLKKKSDRGVNSGFSMARTFYLNNTEEQLK